MQQQKGNKQKKNHLLPISPFPPPFSFKSAATTLAPSRANNIALSRPIPAAAPVMMATFPANLPTWATIEKEKRNGFQINTIEILSRSRKETKK